MGNEEASKLPFLKNQGFTIGNANSNCGFQAYMRRFWCRLGMKYKTPACINARPSGGGEEVLGRRLLKRPIGREQYEEGDHAKSHAPR